MTPEQFKAARNSLGLSGNQMGQMLGYQGDHIRVQINRMETGAKPIRNVQARLMNAYLSGYRPDDWPE